MAYPFDFSLYSAADWARLTAGLLLCVAAANLGAMGAPTGAWRLALQTPDDAERGTITSTALLLWLLGAAVSGLLSFAMDLPPALALLAAAAALASLLVSLRFKLRLGRPALAGVRRVAGAFRARIAGYLLYGVLAGLLCTLRVPMAVFGYALGQLVLSLMCSGIHMDETQAGRRSSWLLLLVAATTLASIWLFPLNPAVFRFAITLPIYALGMGLVLGGQAKRLTMLLVPTLSALLILVPSPYSALGASALFALFFALMRKSLYEAALPLRAMWIRRRARRR